MTEGGNSIRKLKFKAQADSDSLLYPAAREFSHSLVSRRKSNKEE